MTHGHNMKNTGGILLASASLSPAVTTRYRPAVILALLFAGALCWNATHAAGPQAGGSIDLGEKLGAIAVNNDTHQAVILADDKERAYSLNLPDLSVTTIALPTKPKALAIDSTRNLALLGTDKKQGVLFLNLATKAIIGNVSLEHTPAAIAVDPVRGLAVVIEDEKDRIHFIDVTARRLLGTLNRKGKYTGVAIHSGFGRAYAVNPEFEHAGGKIKGEGSAQTERGSIVSVSDKRLSVPDKRFERPRGELLILDLATRTVIGTIPVAQHAKIIAIDETLNLAVLGTDEKDTLEVVDLINHQVVRSYAAPKHPEALAIHPQFHLAVAAGKEAKALSLLDLSTQQFTPNFASVAKPRDLAVSTRYDLALVVSEDKGEVTFVRLPAPAPLLSGLSPPEAIAGAEGFTLTVEGQHFIDGSQIVFDGQNLATRWVSGTKVEADIPASLLTAPREVVVKVTTPAPGGGTSNALTFRIRAPNPVPVLRAIAPASILGDGSSYTLTVTGEGFIPESVAYFNDMTLASTYVSATEIKATLPGNLTQQPGTAAIKVVNPAPGGGSSNSLTLTVAPPGPRIAGFTPTSGPIGTTVTITGERFDTQNPGANDVRFMGERAIVTSATATQLVVIVPVRAVSGQISVSNRFGTTTSQGIFSVAAGQDFNITVTPNTVQVPVKGFGNARVKLQSTGLYSYQQSVAISVSGLPPGVTYTVDRTAISVNNDGLVTLSADGTAAPGSYNISVTGQGMGDLRPATRTQTVSLLILDAATTSVTGRVFHAEDESPFAGIRIRLGNQQAATDETGSYRFLNPPVLGDQVILIDGGVKNTAEIEYPSAIPVPVMIEANRDNVAMTSYLQGIDARRFTGIQPGQATNVTDSDIPNYALRIPDGAVLYGWDGKPIDKVSVRVVPVDKLPIRPLPVGLNSRTVYLYYFFREGGANPTQPIPVTMNNDLDADPGEKVDLWYYDESPTPDPNSNQWRLMGQGTVSADGKSIISDPGVGIPKFCCGATTASRNSSGADSGSPGGDSDGPCAGNPVDLASGNVSAIDFKRFGLQSFLPVNFSCSYRSTDRRIGFLGRGVSFSYDWFAERLTADAVRVTTPQGVRYVLSRESDGIYRARNGRAGALGWELRGDMYARTLRLKDGTEYDFDGPGRLISVRDTRNNKLSFKLDGNGYIESVTDPGARTYYFDRSVVQIGRVRYTLATKITDPTGRSIAFAYDNLAQLTAHSDALNQSTYYVYDAQGRITQKTDPRGAVTRYTYDAQGRATEEILPEGGVYRFAYTVVAGAVTETRSTDPNGHQSVYRFNGQGYETRRVDPLGGVTVSTRDYATNQLRAKTDPAGRVTRYIYDQRGNLVQSEDPAGNLTRFSYDLTVNRPDTITDAAGQITRLEWSQGNLVRITNAAGEVSTFTYTPAGKPASITDPLGHVTRLTYDSAGNLTEVTDPAGRLTRSRYDNANRLVETTDAAGRTTAYAYDALDRLTRVTDALGHTTAYTYDETGNTRTVTDPKGAVIETNTYDRQGRLSARQDALGQAETYTYDGNGNLSARTDRRNQLTRYTYDARNRITRVVYADGRSSDYFYDLAGNLIRVSDSVSGDTLYAYDTLNRVLAETTDRGRVSYAYDALGRLTERRIHGVDPTAYGYDAANRIKTLTYRGQTVSHAYDAGGRLIARTWPNGIQEQRGYSAANELVSLAYRKPDGGTIEQLTYTYDETGNRSSRARSGAGGVRETPFSATYDAGNRMLTFNTDTLDYDAAGNLIRRTGACGATTYTWDARNQLAGIQGFLPDCTPVTGAFSYDYRGRRIEKTVNGRSVRYLYDGPQVIAELSGATIDTTYLTGLEIDEVLARYGAPGERMLLTDALGSVLALTDPQGNPTTTYAYSAYGKTEPAGAPSENPVQYTGRENDNTGLYYYRARYYVAEMGRFISSDPIGLAGGLNTYAYVANRPTVFTDPLGLRTLQCTKPLDALGPKWGPLAHKYGYKLEHQYSCVVRDGEIICGGQDHAGSPLGSPGKPSNDSEGAGQCKETEPDNNCFEECLIDEWAKPRPRYGIPFGTDCQEYDDDVNQRCRKQCNKK